MRIDEHIKKRLDENYIPEPNSGCWLWLLGIVRGGYGQTQIDGKKYLAHRVQWVRFNGPIPKGMFICHHCDTPLCINPNHLFMGNHQDNMSDAVRKGRFQYFRNAFRGEKHPLSKLSKDKVLAIRSDNRKIAEIARDYNVGWSTIGDIKSHRTWEHLI